MAETLNVMLFSVMGLLSLTFWAKTAKVSPPFPETIPEIPMGVSLPAHEASVVSGLVPPIEIGAPFFQTWKVHVSPDDVNTEAVSVTKNSAAVFAVMVPSPTDVPKLSPAVHVMPLALLI
jgi:hypothetical protein